MTEPARPESERPAVFVSYAREDRFFREVVESEIEKLGFAIWRDTRSLHGGEEWALKLDEALTNATALVLLVTDASNASLYVGYEWAFALGAGVPVIPLRCTSGELHPRLAGKHYLDFQGEQRPWDKLSAALQVAREARPRERRLTPSEKRFQELVVELETGDPGVALRGLAQLDHPDVEALLLDLLSRKEPRYQTFDDRDFPIAELLLEALATRKVEACVPYLIARFQRFERESMKPLAQALARIGSPQAVAPLAGALAKAYYDEDQHDDLLDALGQFQGNAEAIEVVRRYLERVQLVPHLDAQMRSAIYALGKLGAREAAEDLYPLLDRESVVEAVIRALVKLDVPEDSHEIALRWAQWPEGLRRDALEVLRGSVDPMALETLARCLLEPDPEDSTCEFAVRAAGLLAELDAAGAPALRGALESPSPVSRAAAAEAVRVHAQPDLTPELGSLLDDPRVVEDMNKLEFLLRIVRSGTSRRDVRVCDLAREALLAIGTPEALELLRRTPPLPDVEG